MENGKWKMLENEVGLLGQLSFLWLMQEWALGRSECLVQLRLLRGGSTVLCSGIGGLY